ncbi:MAG: VCBS repeat-containing protein [Planctomycetes bacterium]|nr:VCBS repeat-containing protein [Planctomycetota bacterium]
MIRLSAAALWLSVLLASALAGQSAPRLQLLSPTPNAILASAAARLEIASSEPLDPATLDASVRVWGRWSGAMTGVRRLENPQLIVFEPSRAFFAGEAVTVMVSSALRSTAGLPLLGGFSSGFAIGGARGSGSFTQERTLSLRASGEGLIQIYGIYAGDIDGDGAPDLSAVNETSEDVRVLRNDGCGGFAPFVTHALPNGSRPSTNEGADFDGDGITDLAIGNIAGNSMSILRGDGAGGYLPAVTYPSGTGTRGLCVLDVEGDGDIDVVTANRVSSNLALHRNRGDGNFLTPATFFDGGGTGETAIAAGDANGDGWADLWVATFTSSRVTVLLNDGAGVFTASSFATVGARPWMIALGDIDGDGDLDAATCDSSANRASLVRGNGAGGVGSVSSVATGSFPLAIDLGDLDGDGDLDLVASNYSAGTFTVWRNTGNGTYTSRQDLPASSAGSCVALVDYDRDGDVDLIGIDEVDDLLFFYRQSGPNAPGVQARSCAATLRLDAFAQQSGFGASQALALLGGRTHFVELSGAPTRPCLVVLGFPSSSALALFGGSWHLDPGSLFMLHSGVLDAAGELRLAVPVPAVPASSASIALQALVLEGSSVVLSNPEQATVR